MTSPALTVYHDGSCPLCRLEISHYHRQFATWRKTDRHDVLAAERQDQEPQQLSLL